MDEEVRTCPACGGRVLPHQAGWSAWEGRSIVHSCGTPLLVTAAGLTEEQIGEDDPRWARLQERRAQIAAVLEKKGRTE